jgi:prepilin-type N-terminal cleavage/methylation domain-containing protein
MRKGFTLIEVVLVLAIAGLILVIVFLAVAGAQLSRRDSQRNNDLSRIASQLEAFSGNNNGNYPSHAQFLDTSAAATAIIKNTNICPAGSPLNAENAASNKLTAFNINSIDIKTIIAFLRSNTPKTPITNKTELNMM